ncbi:hypothetical protein RCCGE510_08980 [Rhizobium sp. CCGE 510]|nr:hypothetical protein RCCGE510_08980 [Rhizobium sp. CCGE 510]
MDAPSDYKDASLSNAGFQSVRHTDIACSRCDIPPAYQNDTEQTQAKPQCAIGFDHGLSDDTPE